MRKLLAGSLGFLSTISVTLVIGAASASAYAGCSPNDTSSPCYWNASSSNSTSNIVIMQGGGDTNFDIVPLSSRQQFAGCYFYGPGDSESTCHPFLWYSANTRSVLISNILGGTPLQAWLGSGSSDPSNLWFPGT